MAVYLDRSDYFRQLQGEPVEDFDVSSVTPGPAPAPTNIGAAIDTSVGPQLPSASSPAPATTDWASAFVDYWARLNDPNYGVAAPAPIVSAPTSVVSAPAAGQTSQQIFQQFTQALPPPAPAPVVAAPAPVVAAPAPLAASPAPTPTGTTPAEILARGGSGYGAGYDSWLAAAPQDVPFDPYDYWLANDLKYEFAYDPILAVMDWADGGQYGGRYPSTAARRAAEQAAAAPAPVATAPAVSATDANALLDYVNRTFNPNAEETSVAPATPAQVEQVQQLLEPPKQPEPAPAPPPYVPFNPVGFDWAGQGAQIITNEAGDKWIYQPNFTGGYEGTEGQAGDPGILTGITKYRQDQTAPGQYYELLDPATGKVTGYGQFQEQSHGFFGDLFDMVGQTASDLAPIILTALSAGALGPVAGSIGTALGATGATATAIGNAAINAALTVAQGGNLEDALKSAVLSGLSQAAVSSVADFAKATGAQIASQVGSDALGQAVTSGITAGAKALPMAIATGDFGNVLSSALTGGVTSGITSGLSNLTGFAPNDINAVVNIAQGASTGDYSKVLAGAGALTDNPDLNLAASATKLITAVNSGNPSQIMAAMQGFGSQVDAYNTRQTTAAAYQDPTRGLDTIIGEGIRNAETQTNIGQEDLTQDELFNIINTSDLGSSQGTGEPAGSATTASSTYSTNPSDYQSFQPDVTVGSDGNVLSTPGAFGETIPDAVTNNLPPGSTAVKTGDNTYAVIDSNNNQVTTVDGSGQTISSGEPLQGGSIQDIYNPASGKYETTIAGAGPEDQQPTLGGIYSSGTEDPTSPYYSAFGTGSTGVEVPGIIGAGTQTEGSVTGPAFIEAGQGTTSGGSTQTSSATTGTSTGAGTSQQQTPQVQPSVGLTANQVKSIVDTAIAANPSLSTSDVQTAINSAIANLPAGLSIADVNNAVTSALQTLPEFVTPSQMQGAINSAVSQITSSQLTSGDVSSIVDKAIAANPGLNVSDVQGVVDKAIANIPPGISKSDVNDAITTALAGLPEFVTPDQMQGAVNNAIDQITGKQLTKSDVSTIVNDAIAANPGLSTSDVQQVVDRAISNIPPGISKEDVNASIADALGKLPPSVTPQEMQGAVNSAVSNLTKSFETGLGQTKEQITQLGESVGEIETRLSDAIANASAVGLKGDAALQQAIDNVATDLGVTKDALLGQLKTTEENLAGQFSRQLAEVSSQTKEQFDQLTKAQQDAFNSLSDAQKAEADARVQQGATLQDAIAQAQAATQEKIAALSDATKAQFDQMDAASQQRFNDLSDAQKTQADLLVQQGADLRDAIAQSQEQTQTKISELSQQTRDALAQQSEQTQQQFRQLTAAQQTQADALVKQNVDLQSAIQQAQAQTQEQITQLSDQTKDLLAQQSQETKAQFDQLTEAQKAQADALVNKGAELKDAIAQVGTSTQEQIRNLGENTQAQFEQLTAAQKTQFDALSDAQKQQADALVEQGNTLQSAIDQVAQGTSQQIQGLSEQTQAQFDALSATQKEQFTALTDGQKQQADALVAQGETLQDAISQVAQSTSEQIQGLSDQTQQQFEQLTATQKDQFEALTDAQKQQADALVQQNIDLKAAIAIARQEAVQQYNVLQEAQRQAELSRQRQAETAQLMSVVQGLQQQRAQAAAEPLPVQELFQASEADLYAMFPELAKEQASKRKQLSGLAGLLQRRG